MKRQKQIDSVTSVALPAALADMPRLEIVYKPISWFKEYGRNPRKNEGAVDRMCASIREFGFAVPMLCRSTGEIVDGHLRYRGAKKLGMQELPTVLCDHWTEAQVKAFRLMVNRSVGWAEWDDDLLAQELADLKGLDFDLSLTGFDEREIDDFLSDPDIDYRANIVPDLPAHPVTVPGDLWLCGKHRVLCDVSTVSEAVSRACARTKPFLMATDPPYGVSYSPEWRVKHDGGGRHALGKVANEDGRAQVFCRRRRLRLARGSPCGRGRGKLNSIGFQIRAQIIWSK